MKPTVILPEAAPIIHLAAADSLGVLNGLGRVVVVDVVALETTYFPDKPFARAIANWIAQGQAAGSNQPVEVAETELGVLYKLALEQRVKIPRNAGELAIAEWLAGELRRGTGPALVVYENGRVPAMLARDGVAETVWVATTRNLLEIAQDADLIDSADDVWRRIVASAPTANPTSALTIIEPMTDPISPTIRVYSAGKLTANQAADRLGIGATVNDVIFLLRQAGLPPPSPPPEQEAAELARALEGLGLARKSAQKP